MIFGMKKNAIIKKLTSRKIRKRELFLLGLIIVVGLTVYFLKDLPLPTKLSSSTNPQSTLIYDRNGKLLYNIYDKKTCLPIAKLLPTDVLKIKMNGNTFAADRSTGPVGFSWELSDSPGLPSFSERSLCGYGMALCLPFFTSA